MNTYAVTWVHILKYLNCFFSIVNKIKKNMQHLTDMISQLKWLH